MNVSELDTASDFETLVYAAGPFIIVTLVAAVALLSMIALSASRFDRIQWVDRAGAALGALSAAAIVIGLLGSVVAAGGAGEKRYAQKLQTLQTWVERSYGIELDEDQLEDLAGHIRAAGKQPVTVERPDGLASSVVLDVDLKGEMRLVAAGAELEPVDGRR